VEERLQVDQDRVLAGRDQVLEVKVGRLQGIQHREGSTLALIETSDFLGGGAGPGGHAFDPPVVAAVEDDQGPEAGVSAAPVQPGEQFLEMHLDGQRLGLVDHLEPRAEPGDQHRPSAPVAVAGAAPDLHEHARVARGMKRGPDRVPVGAEVPEEFQTEGDPVVDLEQELAG
jgi:hypothetical protein